ncbi:MAG: PEP-CTERM sorting domain-containing protein [Cyanobacteria bacterium SBLK]|nr:PEP-CTERM sorting domain-containing protein [Cyanobacteria bacterium SBLK]
MNALKYWFSLPICAIVGAMSLFAGEAIAGTLITATATNDGTNIIVNGIQLQDGDFSIAANIGDPSFTSLGDGWDETIRWDFDFNDAPHLNNFIADVRAGADLQQARLTFNLQPTNTLITTDSTGIQNGQGILIPNIPDVVNSIYQEITFTLDLLQYGFTNDSLLTAFNSGIQNSIPWYWQDDVVMYSAVLTLETEDVSSVPEPATILGLLTLGTVGAYTIKRKKA